MNNWLREEVDEFFRSRDRDFDGHLSFEEFVGEESTMEKLFKNMDRNKDGKVSKQVNCSRYVILKNFFDNDCNLNLMQEFMSICSNLTEAQAGFKMLKKLLNYLRLKVEAAFSKFDITGDKMLSYREFCDMINSHESG